MPTYEYVCDACGYAFDVRRKMTDEPVSSCPKCGSDARQVFSAGFGLNFTGKGFYQTDTKKRNNTQANTEKAGTPANIAEKDGKATHSCGKSCSCSGGCSCST